MKIILLTIYILSFISFWLSIVAIAKRLIRKNGKVESDNKKSSIEKYSTALVFLILSLIPVINSICILGINSEAFYYGLQDELYGK